MPWEEQFINYYRNKVSLVFFAFLKIFSRVPVQASARYPIFKPNHAVLRMQQFTQKTIIFLNF